MARLFQLFSFLKIDVLNDKQDYDTNLSILYKPQARDSRAIQRGSTYSLPSGSEEQNEEHNETHENHNEEHNEKYEKKY